MNKTTKVINQNYLKSIFLMLGLAFSQVVMAQDNVVGNLPMNSIGNAGNGAGNGTTKNPFVKPTKIIPNNPPKGLPNDFNSLPIGVGGNNNNVNKETFETPESREAKFEWTNMRVVGFINDHVLVRVEDLNNNNGNGNNNGGSYNNNSNNNNNNGNGNNNNNRIITLMVTLNERFFFNKNYYTLKKEKNFFVVYNKNNMPMHSMILESSAARLIPREGSNGGSSGSSGGTVNSNSGATVNSNQGGNSVSTR